MGKPAYLRFITKPHHKDIEIATLESLLNTLSDAAIIINPAVGKVLCANIKASELTAYSRSELIDMPLDYLLHPLDEMSTAALFDGYKEGSHLETAVELLHHNGSRVPSILTITFIPGNDKLALVIIKTHEDYTHRSQEAQRQQNLWSDLNKLVLTYTHHALPLSLQQVLTIASSLSGAAILSIYLADGKSTTLRQVATLDPASILPETISPHDLQYLIQPVLWINGKRPIASLHLKVRAAQLGFIASAPIGEANTAIGLFAAAGNGTPPESILEIVQYLANQVYAHKKIKNQISQLRNDLEDRRRDQLTYDTIFESIDDGLIYATPQRQIIKLNNAAELALGYTNSEVQDLSIINILICNENLETMFRFVEEEFRPSSSASVRLYRRNGESFNASLRVIPISENEKLHSILVLLHDLSEQEEYKARNQMLEQRATLADITASFAHEVRNPINNISTGLQLLEHNLPQSDSNYENITRLQNDCERLADLVKSGLSFVRPVEYKIEPVDLGKVISNLMDRWRNRLTRTQVKYNPQIDPNPIMVEGDLRALEQVFTNLIDNAIQAMELSGGVLTINVRQIDETYKHSHVEVNILDTGPGIPPDVREHIFEPFFTTKSTGTGLGLAIVKRIVTAHKGSIHVITIPGGTMFRVRIPCRA